MAQMLYVYSPDDFEEGLPDERNGVAYTRGQVTLTLKEGAVPTLMEVEDDDEVLNEIDSGQTLSQALDLDGAFHAAGTTVHSSYDLLNYWTGHQVTTLHFGGDGYEQGAVHGLVSSQLMEPGQSYRFHYNRTSHQQDNRYDEFVPCFAADTRIACRGGARHAGEIRPGDMVVTVDDGEQPVTWSGAVTVAGIGRLAPVEIAPGALGNTRHLRVSQQHRMLVRHPQVELLSGEGEALVAARHLAGLPGIEIRPVPCITYVHFSFACHQLVQAEGAPAESFLPEPMALAGLPDALRAEFLTLFPEFEPKGPPGRRLLPTARPVLSGREARLLAS